MPGSQFRKWAMQIARQAGEELDNAVASRLLSIAENYNELAEREEALLASSAVDRQRAHTPTDLTIIVADDEERQVTSD